MNSLQTPRITGDYRPTKDPELRYTASNRSVTNLRLAGNRYVKTAQVHPEGHAQAGKSIYSKKAVFITVVAWGKLAESVFQNVKKGDLISISAVLDQREWKKEGTDKPVTLLEPILETYVKRSENSKAAEAEDSETATPEESVGDEEVGASV
jgi:single-strand DNA-binding protein